MDTRETTKEQLIKTIKEWVRIDNEIRLLEKEQKTRKQEKKRLSDSLLNIMKQNEIDCFDINDGKIMYQTKKSKKPITKKMLFDVLSKFYGGDYMKTTELNEFILENREEITKECIVRKINKNLEI
jgi:hypothetical protein